MQYGEAAQGEFKAAPLLPKSGIYVWCGESDLGVGVLAISDWNMEVRTEFFGTHHRAENLTWEELSAELLIWQYKMPLIEVVLIIDDINKVWKSIVERPERKVFNRPKSSGLSGLDSLEDEE